MATVPETLQALYAVQQIDTQMQRAKKAQGALDNGTTAQAAMQAARDEAARRKTALNTLSGELKDSELRLDTLENKRKNYQNKLYQGSVTSPRELENIQKEIEMMGRQRSDLDGRVLELMEAVEQAGEALTLAEAQAAEAAERHARTVAAFRSRFDALALELTGLAAQRDAAAASVDDRAALARYDALRAKGAGVGIARIEGGTCGGCRMALSSTTIKAVKENAQIQTCENCGRLLLA